MSVDLQCMAVWTQASGGQWVDGPMEYGPFSEWVAQKFAEGFRVNSLQLVNVDGSLQYQGIVLPGDGGEFITPPLPEAGFASWYSSYFSKGYHLATLDIAMSKGNLYYAGTVRSGSGAQWFHPATDWATFSAWATGLFDEGFRLTAFTSCVRYGQVLYSGAMTAGTATGSQYMTAALGVADFTRWSEGYFAKGYQVTAMNAGVVNGQVMVAGVVSQQSGAQWLSAPITLTEFGTEDAARFAQGFHATSLSVFDLNDRYGQSPIRYRIGLNSFAILNTRSRHEDTDFVSASLSIPDAPTQTLTRSMGDLNNGTFDVDMVFQDVTLNTNQSAVLSYAIVNSGHSDPSTIEKDLESATSALAEKGAQAAATAAGTAIGAAVGAEIGTAVIPIIGSALGALAGWLTSEVGSLLFANCDGPVAAGMHPLSCDQLAAATANGATLTQTDDQPGMDSASGCGSNSHYTVTWSAART